MYLMFSFVWLYISAGGDHIESLPKDYLHIKLISLLHFLKQDNT